MVVACVDENWPVNSFLTASIPFFPWTCHWEQHVYLPILVGRAKFGKDNARGIGYDRVAEGVLFEKLFDISFSAGSEADEDNVFICLVSGDELV